MSDHDTELDSLCSCGECLRKFITEEVRKQISSKLAEGDFNISRPSSPKKMPVETGWAVLDVSFMRVLNVGVIGVLWTMSAIGCFLVVTTAIGSWFSERYAGNRSTLVLNPEIVDGFKGFLFFVFVAWTGFAVVAVAISNADNLKRFVSEKLVKFGKIMETEELEND